MLKGLNRMRLWFKLAEISGEMEGEDTIEERLRVFRARFHVVLDREKSFGRICHCATDPGWFHAIKESFNSKRESGLYMCG